MCDPDPCLNGGTCLEGGCSCPPPYSGEYCEIGQHFDMYILISVKNAFMHKCLLFAKIKLMHLIYWFMTMLEFPMRYNTIICNSNYLTLLLSFQTDPCIPNPCLNGGTCDVGLCTCTEGFTGQNCETG